MAKRKGRRPFVVMVAKNELLQLWGRLAFDMFQRIGIHVTPVHYYEPIPNTLTLKRSLWERPSELVGVNMNGPRQIELLEDFKARFKAEYDRTPRGRTSVAHEYYWDNNSYIGADGDMLYCMIRHFKPRRLFEIGSGNSTYMSARAVLENERETGQKCEYVVFDPYPNPVIKNGIPGLTKVVESGVEDVDVKVFESLEENDILFIDSSHVLRIGNDVQFLYLEALPRLKKGTVVHVHDIFLPEEYPIEWVFSEHFFWNEQYLLQSFLTFNGKFEVIWASRYMHTTYPEEMSAAFQSCGVRGMRPCSLWMRRTQ